jgi:hypothetical protein
MLAREGRRLADICRGHPLLFCADRLGGHDQLLVAFVDAPLQCLVRLKRHEGELPNVKPRHPIHVRVHQVVASQCGSAAGVGR